MGHRNLSYRIWKHLNKRMVRYSQTRKKRIFDPVRYRIWKYLGERVLTAQDQLQCYQELNTYLQWLQSPTFKQWQQFTLFKRSYDFVFSIGRSCHCSTTLRKFGIQKYSYPFDWSGGRLPIAGKLGFDGKIRLLCNGLSHLTDFSDLEEFTLPENKKHRSIVNNRTGLQYLHEFPWEETIEEHYPIFKEKYDRRAARLLKRIDESKNVLMVWIHGLWDQINQPGDKLKPDDIKQSMAYLEKAFPGKNMDLLCLNHDPSVGDKIILDEVSPHILFVRSNHMLFDKAEAQLHQPIPQPIKKILRSLSIKKSPSEE